MADILCPNCGMPNPDDQNLCSFCRQPLRTPEDTSSIRPGDMPTKKTTAELEPILPEWLRAARARSREGSGEDDAEVKETKPTSPEKKEPEVTDWLAGLAAAAQEDEEEDIPDWMRGPSTPAPAKPEKEEEAFPRRQELQWEAEPADEPVKPVEETPSDDGIPFWMKGLESGAEEPPEEKKELSDWFSKQEPPAKQSSVSPFEQGTFRPNTGELFSWLDDTAKPAAPETPAPKADQPAGERLPDWIANLGREEQGTAQPPVEPASTEAASFDWLKDEASKPFAPFQKSQMADETPTEEIFGANFDLPDWMSSSAESPASKPEADASSDWIKPAEESPAPKQEESGSLDWMKSLGETPAAQPEQGGIPDWAKPADETPAPSAEDTGLPDWMKSLGETPAAQPEQGGVPDWAKPADETHVPSAEDAGLPDWMKSLGQPSAVPPEQADVPEWAKPAAESPIPPAEDTGLPDWMRSQGQAAPAEETGAGSELPAWMMTGQTPTPPEEKKPEVPVQPPSTPAFIRDELMGVGEADELFSADLPDWLSNIAPTEQKSAAPSQEQPQEDVISPADLPSWVQAMRPVETALPETPVSANVVSQPAENQGPLAGLSGVLPAVPGFAPAGKPKSYSLRLQPTQDQMEHAALLEQMLAAETEAKPFRAASSVILSQRVLRWVVAGILLVVVAVSLFAGLQLLPLPASLSPEADLAQSAIISLPDNAPVLMVFDYEPALAGEMEAASAAFVDQMIALHHPRISVLSTSPTGSALAERFMSTSPARQSYQSGQDFIDLGYLTGESAGIAALATNPRAAIPLEFVWASPALQDVTSFSDFALVILLTDRAETARAWVEQTEGQRNGRPFVIVSSAQAAPMIQPYLLSGQVNGLVSGLHDGASFEQSTGSYGSARQYWDAYNLSILIVCVMIVVGGLWNWVLGIRSHRQGLDEG